jgi:pseudaminic acid cytidylyltransferase
MVTMAVIPARGGSKRIPRKNIKLFHGKPIIAYSIETAAQSGLFDRVVVSTDDEEIAEVAQKYGAEVPFIRPKKLSDDMTGTHRVVDHALSWFQSKGIDVKYACCIYATAPLLQESYLRLGYEKLKKGGQEFLLSIAEYPFPIQRALFKNEEKIYPVNEKNYGERSQDLRQAYHDAAQFYWGTSLGFKESSHHFGQNTGMILLPRHYVCDIDTPMDWLLAEKMFEVLKIVCP